MFRTSNHAPEAAAVLKTESQTSSVDPLAVRRAGRVFLVFLALYLFTWAGHYTSGDGFQKIAWGRAMLFHHSADIDPGPGVAYSKYGIGHSLIAIPPLAIAHYVQKTFGIHCEAALYTLLFIINGALFLALVSYYLSRIYAGNRVWPVVITLGIATTWWPYTKLDYSEPLVTTLLFIGFLGLRNGFLFFGMLIAGFTLTIRMDAALLVAPLIAWALWRERTLRQALNIATALLPSVALILIANYVRYHSLLDRGYAGEGFTTPLLAGLYGILLSPGKSVFLFSPPLLLVCFAWKRFYQRAETRLDACFFLAVFVLQVLFYSKWWDWSSDDAWGVRFLIPGVMLMCIPLVELARRRPLLVLVTTLGVFIQVLAVGVGGLDFLLLLRGQNLQRQAVYVGGRNRVDFEDLRFNPNYSQIAGNWLLLRQLLHIPPRTSSPQLADRAVTPLYDCLPPEAWQRAAQWDFIWLPRHSSATASKAE